jgi:hypothetical protein
MRRIGLTGKRGLWLFAGSVVLITIVALFLIVNGQTLPETRPRNFSVTYKAYIPEAELYEELVIAPLGSYYQYTYKTSVSRINFTLSQAELDAVYDVFRGAQFDRIPSGDNDLTTNETGTLVELEAGRRTYVVVESPENVIPEAWAGSWQFVRQAIASIRGREFQDQAFPITIQLDSSLVGAPLRLYFNREVLFEGDVDSASASLAVTLEKIPGNYLLEAVVGPIYTQELTINESTLYILAFTGNQLTLNGVPMQLVEE